MADTGPDPLTRAEELSEKAARRPLDLRDDRAELGDLLTTDDPAVRGRALGAVVTLATAHPEAAASLVDPLTTCLATPALRDDAALAIGHVVREDPSTIPDVLPALVSVLDEPGPGRANTTWALAGVAASDPAALARKGILRRTFPLLDDDSEVVRTNVTMVLSAVAREDPEAVCDGLAALADRLDDPVPGVRRNATAAMGWAAQACPDSFLAELDDVVARLDDEDPATRQAAAFALGYPTRLEGDAVETAVESLVGRLDHEAVRSRRHATVALWHLATVDSAAVSVAVEPLTRRLADDDGAVRRNAIGALAVLEVDFPEEIATAREELVASIGAIGGEAGSDDFHVRGLDGLAGEPTAPDDIVRAAANAAPVAGASTKAIDVSDSGSEVSDDEETEASNADAEETPEADAAVRFCANCGESIEGSGEFCPACGTPL